MKNFKLNLSKFKKVKEDQHKVTFQHEDGHEFHVAKKALSPKLREQLAVIPERKQEMKTGKVMLADGGVADNADKPMRPPEELNSIDDIKNALFGDKSASDNNKLDIVPSEDQQVGVEQYGPPQPQQGGATNVQPVGLTSSIAPGDQQQGMLSQGMLGDDQNRAPAGQDGTTTQQSEQPPNLMAGYSKQQQGIQGEAQAEGALGNVQADTLDQSVNREKNNIKLFKDQIDQLNTERQNHIQDINSNMIDPKKYWQDHSKLATTLGILISGFSFNQGPNPAYQVLHQQMEQNLDAQTKNLNEKNNLLAANLHQFGNMRDAMTMTRIMQNDMVVNQLKSEAAKAQDPLVRARALEVAGKLDMESVPKFMDLAMRKALVGTAQQGGGTNGQQPNTDQMLSYLRVVNPDMAKEMESRYVPGVGMGSIPLAPEVRKELTARQSLQEQVSKLRDWSKQHEGEVLNREDVNYGKALSNSVQDAYRRANGQGVFREAESNFVKGIVAEDPTSFFNKFRVDPKYKALEDSNNIELNTLKKSNGLPVQSPESRLTPQQQQLVKIARQHPENPKSQMFLKKMGLDQ